MELSDNKIKTVLTVEPSQGPQLFGKLPGPISVLCVKPLEEKN